MDSLDKKVITYDGVWDMLCLDREDQIAYTSIRTTSSSMMPKNEFRNYLNTGFKYHTKPIYIRKDYMRYEK